MGERAALVVVDAQKAFEDPSFMGRPNNPACDRNIGALIAAWREHGQPLVYVRHDSTEPGSRLRPGQPGNALKDVVSGEPDLLVVKSVNSAFHGEPDLAGWLRENGVEGVVVCGIQTNMCAETTARVAANLGFDMRFAIDATQTFDLGGFSADELARVTAANLDAEFGRVVTTAEAIAALAG